MSYSDAQASNVHEDEHVYRMTYSVLLCPAAVTQSEVTEEGQISPDIRAYDADLPLWASDEAKSDSESSDGLVLGDDAVFDSVAVDRLIQEQRDEDEGIPIDRSEVNNLLAEREFLLAEARQVPLDALRLPANLEGVTSQELAGSVLREERACREAGRLTWWRTESDRAKRVWKAIGVVSLAWLVLRAVRGVRGEELDVSPVGAGSALATLCWVVGALAGAYTTYTVFKIVMGFLRDTKQEIFDMIARESRRVEAHVTELQTEVRTTAAAVREVSNRASVTAAIVENDMSVITASAISASNGVTAVSQQVAPTIVKIDAVVEAVGTAGLMAVGFMETYAFMTVLLSVVALGRNLYQRWTKKPENKESQVLGMTEGTVFKIFDAMAITMVIPLILSEGAGGAIKMWRTLKTISAMIRDACGAVHLYTRFFGDSTVNSERPMTGVGFVEDLAAGADELVGRMETRKEGLFGSIFDDEPSSSSPDEDDEKSVPPPPPANGCGHYVALPVAPGATRAVQLPVAQPILHCVLCRKAVCEHSGKAIYAGLFKKPEPDTNPVFNDLRKIWTQQEDQAELSKLRKMTTERPWMLPVVLVVIFAMVLLVSRWTARSSTKEERKQLKKERREALKAEKAKITPETFRGPANPKIEAVKAEPKEDQERKSTNVAKKSIHRKPWVSSGSSDSEEQGVLYQDEKGNIQRRAGRRAARAADQKFALKYSNQYGPIQHHAGDDFEGLKGVLFVNATAEEIREATLIYDVPAVFVEVPRGPSKTQPEAKTLVQKSVAAQKKALDVKSGPQEWHKTVTCNKCNLVGHVRMFCPKPPTEKKEAGSVAVAKAKADAMLAVGWCDGCNQRGHVRMLCTNMEVPEANVNGPRFDVSHVKQAIGWAEVVAGDKLSSMNCVAVWNGIRVCEHIFAEGGDEVTFTYGDHSVTVSQGKGKKIGNDSLFFPRTKDFDVLKHIKPLQTALPIEGTKCRLIAFDSKSDQAAGREKSDDGIVKRVITSPGEERAYSNYSSVHGSCTGPVVDVNGKLIGVHNANAGADNVFVPITKHMLAVATGCESSF